GDRVLVETSLGHEGLQDQRHTRRGVLLTNLEQERALRWAQLPRAPLVLARLGAQATEPVGLVGIVPPLQRRDRVRLRRGRARRAEALLAQLTERLRELAAIERAMHQRADDLAPVQRHGFGVVLGGEQLVHESSSLSPATPRRPWSEPSAGPPFC